MSLNRKRDHIVFVTTPTDGDIGTLFADTPLLKCLYLMELINKLAHFSFVMVVLFITFGMCKNTTPPHKKRKEMKRKIISVHGLVKLPIKASNLLSLTTIELFLLNDTLLFTY